MVPKLGIDTKCVFTKELSIYNVLLMTSKLSLQLPLELVSISN
ncbi:UNVERIFIED_CONTAM: hypothetical protein GTU68_053033 [Idotea baltica]|nr:hypothetical protein [Idotea baltica]